MDLKQLDVVGGANEGFEFELLHPTTNAPLGIFITVLGQDSDEFRRVLAEHNQRRVDKFMRNGVYRPGPLTMQELEANAIDLLAASTKAWRDADAKVAKGTIVMDEKAYPCNRENAIRIYTANPWIREQVDLEVGNRANFLRGSKKP